MTEEPGRREQETLLHAESLRIADALRASEEKYRAIFEQAADSIVIIDPENGKLLDFNPRAYEGLGYSREQFKTIKMSDFEAMESEDRIRDHLKEVIDKGSDVFESKHKRRDGEIRDIYVSAKKISINGKCVIQSIWKDITDIKHSERNLQKVKEELETSVAERTAELKDLNTALRILLDQREKEKQRLEETIAASLKQLVIPYVEKLKKARLPIEEKTYVQIMDANLSKIASSFAVTLAGPQIALTYTELQVADMIANGMSSKEIAMLLNISFDTVAFHRKNIRAKLGIAKCKVNLRSYLQTFRS